MTIVEDKILEATKNILEKNMKVLEEPYVSKKIVLIYDLESELSRLISEWYIKNLENNKNSEILDINKENKEELVKKLWALEENTTVILVQSTNFRLDNFRIRLQLHNNNVWCLEHNHLGYMKDDEYETYADAITYMTPYYDELWAKLKTLSDNSKTKTFICKDGSTLKIEWGFEDMKKNTWNYEGKKRWWTFPIWENFTEAADFDQVNGELSISIYPWFDFKIRKVEKPFKIKIEKSIITWVEEWAPEEFMKLLETIKESENNEVFIRELWFWLNPNINDDKILSEVNFFERKAWFHISLWKKHQIYRKKMHKSIVQRYHIDIFPAIDKIYIDDTLIFEWGEYLL